MLNKVKKAVVLLLIVLLAVPVSGQNTIRAQEEEYSVSSAETFIHESGVSGNERRQLFNDNWKFIYGEQSNAQVNTYDDSSWDDVQLPHDYSLSLPYSQKGEAESGYKLGGIGWYRNSFTMDEAAKDKRVMIEFGGVYMNATVYINGHKLGDHPNGYTPFAYDLTDHINYDGENVIAVRVNHKFPSSRWYSGSGIYRNVHLTITDDVHVDHYGVQVLTPNLEDQLGKDVDVEVNANIENKSSEDVNAVVKQSIREKGTEDNLVSGESDSLTIKANDSVSSNVSVKINDPKLWSLSNPNLYEIVTEVLVDDQVIDEYVTDYGFRTFEFDADTGFKLNGENVKLKGVSMHSDQGSLGAAAHERAMERQVEILLDMGVNAIRVTHNPAADELIEIANNKGMLVIDESFDTWVGSKNGNTNDYAVWFNEKVGDNPLLGATADMTWAELDTKTMVRRGINAPSIISWSVGNEVMEGNSGPYDEYPDILEQLATWVGEVDKTRPSTIGDNKLKANWGEAIKFGEKITALDGTVGFNYADGSQFDRYHKDYPDWKMYGAETASSINSRGVYKPSNYDRHLTSYDESAVGWGKFSADSWYEIITRDFMAGEFVWTGFDYLGEPTPWNNVGPGATEGWPSPKSSYFGIVDTAGLPKDRFYFYQSQWNDEVDTLHVLPAWKEDMVEINDGNVRVDVYSDARSVELFFKDVDGEETSLGKKEFTPYTTDAGHTYQVYEGDDKKGEDFRNLYLTWDVPYEDGTVYAVGYDADGNVIKDTEGRDSVTTFKEASDLKLAADRESIVADGRDLSYITIDVTDENGDIVEDAANLMDVSVEGDGELIALDNGDQVDHEPYDSGQRKAFNGKLVAIVKSTKDAGEMTLNVESEGIKGQSITITTTPDPEQSDETYVIGYTMPKNYYVKLGHQPELVSETKLLLSDGTEETHPITWDVEKEMFDEPGVINVTGHVEEYNLRVLANVTVIESVGALLNYSLSTSAGVNSVNLPSSRPLVLENGDVLQTEFPVEWEEQDSQDFEETGIVTIDGTSNVFGESIPVTASVRVADAELTLGDNIAGNNLTLTQSIPEEFQSDSLEAIVDGNTDFETVQEGPNPSVWTNYDMAQTGHNQAEIIFTYATAQFLGSADLYFYQDAWAARLPENVELYWSNEGTEDANWTKIENVEETIGETSEGTPNITKANYRFSGVPAVGFKIVLTSDPGTNDAGKKLAVGLSEVELRVEHSSLKDYTEATLDNILLNGVSVSSSQLKNKVINTEYQKVDVETESDQNVATTVLKPYENVVRIITESEDHLTREVYTINLDQPASEGDLSADDDSRDYPYGKTTATAGDYHKDHATEGDPNYAVDNDEGTIFHTPWGGTDKSNFWITLEMEEETTIDALRYLSRSGNRNGIVKDYIIETSLDNETWEEVSVGQWSSENDTWSIAEFDEPKEAKYVRLTAKSTYGDGAQADQFMTAKEIRLRKAADAKESLESAEVTLDQDIFAYDGESKTPKATVTLDTKDLEEGIDYSTTYENNVEAGEATIIIKGIAKYEGTLEKTFNILDKSELESLVTEAKELNLDDYSEDVAKSLDEAIKVAEDALENAETQAELEEAFDNLADVIENLDKEPGDLDNKALTAKLAEANELDLDGYTEDSVQALNKAIASAEEALEKAETQAELDEALDNLTNAIEELEKEPGQLDDRALTAKLAEANELDLDGYTEESVQALNKAITSAEEALEKAETQAELDEALDNLTNAIEELEKEPGQLDNEALTAKLAEAKDLDLAGYTADSVQALNKAITSAEEVLEKAETQAELDEALNNLTEAIKGLEKEQEKLDKTALTTKLAEAKDLDLDGYTADSVQALNKAIASAEAALENAETQAELDKALGNLTEAIKGLEKEQEKLDKTALTTKLSEAKDIDLDGYTEESVQALNKAITFAEEALENATTQEALDKASEELDKAISNLVEKETPTKVDKTELEKLLEKNAEKDAKKYTDKSWSTFTEAMEHGKEVLANEEATQKEVDQAISDLEKAVKSLAKKVDNDKNGAGSNEQTDKPGTEGSKDGEELPATASTMYNYLLIGLLLTISGACFIIFRRKKGHSA